MSDEKPSGDSSRRHFLSAAAVVSAAVAAPTAAEAQTLAGPKPPKGIKRKDHNGADTTVPEFAMPPDAVPGIAQVIVNIWTGASGLDQILKRDNQGFATQAAVDQATAAINAAYPYFKLKRVVIISEDEHDDGYMMQYPYEVVFVLPDVGRVIDTTASATLLNSAKLLMACTPNGI